MLSVHIGNALILSEKRVRLIALQIFIDLRWQITNKISFVENDDELSTHPVKPDAIVPQGGNITGQKVIHALSISSHISNTEQHDSDGSPAKKWHILSRNMQ